MVGCGYSSREGYYSHISRENTPGFLCSTECPAWRTWIPASQVFPVLCNMVGLPVTSVHVLEPGNEGGLLAAPPLPLSRSQPSDAVGVIWAFQNVILAMLLPSP